MQRLNHTLAIAGLAVGLALALQLDSPEHRLAFVMFLAGMSLLVGVLTETRTKTARALRHAEARRAAVVEASLDCIVTTDARGRIIEFNPAAETTFGYRREQALGRELAALIVAPAMRDACRAGLAEYLHTDRGAVARHRIETTAMRADGSEFSVELAIVRIDTDDAALFKMFLRDLSECTQAANGRRPEDNASELLQASRAEARRNALFLNAISHDLRTPFNGLI